MHTVVKPWAPPGWHVRFLDHGRVEYLLRDSYYQSAFAYYQSQTGHEDNTDSREEAIMCLARGLFFTPVAGTA
jgi:hypothetical protein